jgi:predicted kinase
MPTPPSVRSVKIGADERGGWTTERPPREGDAPPRPVDVSARCRVLAPSDRMRYSPGSLLLIVSPDASESERFAERVVEERGAVLSLAKVRTLLAGRIAEEEIEARAHELLDAAVVKRLGDRQTIVLTIEGLDAAERERYVRLAHGLKRPRHLILLEVPRDRVPDEERATLNELRRALDSGEVGQEGFQTALRLSGGAAAELKRIVFQPPPRED